MTGTFIQLAGVVIDLVCKVDQIPEAGAEVETPYLRAEAGGGFNAMAAAARMGVSVVYAGTLGTGLMADLALQAILAEKIALLSNERVAGEQGSCVAITDRNAQRSFISHHGAERQVSREHLSLVKAGIQDILLLTGYALYKAESASTFVPWLDSFPRVPRLLFDPGPMIAEIPAAALDAAFHRADWLSLNADEARFATGSSSAADAARQLSANRAGAIVRTGGDGCWLGEPGGPARHIPAFNVSPVDSNGAGDAHNGAFIAALLIGCAPSEAAVIANAAAALSTLKPGPATSPDLATLQHFLARCGIVLPPSAQAAVKDRGHKPVRRRAPLNRRT